MMRRLFHRAEQAMSVPLRVDSNSAVVTYRPAEAMPQGTSAASSLRFVFGVVTVPVLVSSVQQLRGMNGIAWDFM